LSSLERVTRSQAAPFLTFFVVYVVCLFLLLPHLSLWLDEVLNVIGSEKSTFPGLLDYVAHNSGGVPLGYFAQRFSIGLLGFSEFSARVPSAVSSLAAALGMFALASHLNARFPTLPAILFCLVPLQWRYAVEARPYSMALALTIWSTVVFLQLLQKPRPSNACLYSVLVLAGLYTNPYSLFVPIGHVLWLFRTAFEPKTNRTALTLTVLANAFAVLVFLPWYLHVRHLWAMDVPNNSHTGVFKLFEVILKELVGGGYVGTILVLALAAIGTKYLLATSRGTAYLLLFWVAATIGLPLLGNALFHYFFAARQMIFALAPLCLLAGLGIEAIGAQYKNAAIGLAALLAAVCLFNDVNLFLKPRENWRAAAVNLKKLSGPDTCLVFIPADSLNLYRVFDPTLSDDKCSEHLLSYRELVLAASPYIPADVRKSAFQSIPTYFQKEREWNGAGPTIHVYRRK
jgi:mannosyltransferase